jgi:hypothetical protein
MCAASWLWTCRDWSACRRPLLVASAVRFAVRFVPRRGPQPVQAAGPVRADAADRDVQCRADLRVRVRRVSHEHGQELAGTETEVDALLQCGRGHELNVVAISPRTFTVTRTLIRLGSCLPAIPLDNPFDRSGGPGALGAASRRSVNEGRRD